MWLATTVDTARTQNGSKSTIQYIKKNLSVSRGGEGASKDAQVLRVRLEHTDELDSQEILKPIISSIRLTQGPAMIRIKSSPRLK